jgi:L-2,4-diaminobutyrate decarboxylase
VDMNYRMRTDALNDGLARAGALGRRVIAVVGSACTTATGSFDPLTEIADFCAAHQLWFHVDGAHGASWMLSNTERHRLAGIERADSVVWDAHKMLMMPALITGVLFRDAKYSATAFAQDASYLLEGRGEDEWYNLASRTFECTKRMMSFKLYAALSLYGTQFFADYIARTSALARAFAALIRQQPDFELAVEPECNIVCFRYTPGHTRAGEELSALQSAARMRVIQAGRFYPVQTRLHGDTWLRVTLMNPFTTEAHLDQLLAEVRG